MSARDEGARSARRRLWFTARTIALGVATACVVACAVLHLAGARALVGTLSGTVPASDLDVSLGLAYAVAWFSTVLVAPILVLAVIFDVACGTLITRLRAWRASRRL